MKKIIFTLVILFVAILCIKTEVFAKDYTDMDENHWAYPYVQYLSDRDIVAGYPDGTFRPDDNLTRAEFATMIIRALGQQDKEIEEIIEFSDVKQGFWAWGNIQRAVYFDLVKGLPDGTFLPQDNVSKIQAIAVVVNSLKLDDLPFESAKEILAKAYDDASSVDNWAVIFAGKAEQNGIIIKLPGYERLLEPNRAIKRGELAAYLYKMIELTKVKPNEKVGEALKRKASDGIIIDNVIIDGIYAIIPEGTVIPVKLNQTISSQKVFIPQEFTGKLPNNIISYDYDLLLEEGDHILGHILDFKKAYFLIRNGKMVLETRAIRTELPQTAQFCALSEQVYVPKSFISKFFRAIFKGGKVEIKNGEIVNVKLIKQIKINLTTGEIIDY